MKLKRRQRAAFKQRDDEDPYAYIARTIRTLRYRDLPQLLLTRNQDRMQVEAIQLYATLKLVKWTRALTFGTLALGIATIIAALIVRGW